VASCTFLDGESIVSDASSSPDWSMRPEIFKLPLPAGILLIGRAHHLARITGVTEIDVGLFGSWLRDLLAHADSWRLRGAAAVLGVDEFDPRQRTEQRLQDQIARMLETGRLSACFLPLFCDDSHALNDAGPLRVLQLGGGPPPTPAAAPARSDSAPPPQRTQVRSAAESESDFDDEDAQIAVLRAAAKDGTPFCEKCARAAIRRARAARDAA